MPFIYLTFQISIVDFICKIEWPGALFADPTNKRIFFHLLSSFVCLLLVLLSDMNPIIAVASLSIFALVLSFAILLVYGFVQYGITFSPSMLVPASTSLLFSAIGVPSFSLGYNFSFLSFYVASLVRLSSRSSSRPSPSRKLRVAPDGRSGSPHSSWCCVRCSLCSRTAAWRAESSRTFC